MGQEQRVFLHYLLPFLHPSVFFNDSALLRIFVLVLLILPPTAMSKALSALKDESAVNLVMDTCLELASTGKRHYCTQKEQIHGLKGS